MPVISEKAKADVKVFRICPSRSQRFRKKTQKKTQRPAFRAAQALKIRGKIAKLAKELADLNIPDIPTVTLSQVHDPNTGRIDAHKLAEYIGVALKPFSEGLGLNYKAVHRNPSGASIQPALRPVKRSLEILQEFFGPVETVRAWLNTPHPGPGWQHCIRDDSGGQGRGRDHNTGKCIERDSRLNVPRLKAQDGTIPQHSSLHTPHSYLEGFREFGTALPRIPGA